MPSLSVLIPARNEQWLTRTVADVLEHSQASTEVIVVLDGAWPDPGLPIDPRVHVLYHPTARGQRAATNEAARISTARYICKLDAHCSVAPGWDVSLLEGAAALEREVIQVPAQKNLHVFDWVCGDTSAVVVGCGWRAYQGPTPASCPQCASLVVSRDIRWKPRRGTTTSSWVFDAGLHFQYDKLSGQRPDAAAPIRETMSCLGACWFLDREWFLKELGGLDEQHGSYGQMGTELACKAWLSGGRMVCNTTTWFAHLFRTQGGDFGFPFPITGKEIDAARSHSRRLWLNNAWPGQARPLSWLIERFAPASDWHDPGRADALARVVAADAAFPLREESGPSVSRQGVEVSRVSANGAPPSTPVTSGVELQRRQEVAAPAVSLSGGDSGRARAPEQVLAWLDQSQMRRVATAGPRTGVVDDQCVSVGRASDRSDGPGEHDAMQPGLRTGGIAAREADTPIAEGVGVTGPHPAAAAAIDGNLREDARQLSAVEATDHKECIGHARGSGRAIVPRSTSGVIYYSDSLPDQDLLVACRRQLRRAAGARPIVAVTLPAHGVNGFALGDPSFEGMEHVVLPKARGYLTMFEQILTALRLLSTDYVHFAEHDVLYSAEHFDEVPAGEPFAYNTNVWKVDARTGRALHYICEQTSGLSGRRDHLIDHYERRIAHVKAHGFTRRMGFEPGKEVRHGGIDGVPRWPWQSSRPNVDIRHGANLTPSRWSRDQFRNPKYTKGWTEADAVPSWGQTAGRFPEWLAEVTTHG